MQTQREHPHILIVDDNPSNVQILAEVLQPQYEVFFATTAAQALKVTGSKEIDLILLDIMMPDVDGYELCQLFKLDQRLREIPIIFVTAKSEIDDEAKGFAVGAVDYITKPISPPIVQARVKTHLELKSQRDYLQALSNYDGLTGVPNRRYFDATLQRELLRAARDHLPLSLFLIDVDFFKQYNDQYGHIAGDDALKQIAQTLAKTLQRPSDFVARYGGEEFAVICSNTDTKAADLLARRLLDQVAALSIPHDASSIASVVTISIGAITLFPPTTGHQFSPKLEEILTQVDTLLYEAKKHGRNQFWLDSAQL